MGIYLNSQMATSCQGKQKIREKHFTSREAISFTVSMWTSFGHPIVFVINSNANANTNGGTAGVTKHYKVDHGTHRDIKMKK